jgi:hypothetical protein
LFKRLTGMASRAYRNRLRIHDFARWARVLRQ